MQQSTNTTAEVFAATGKYERAQLQLYVSQHPGSNIKRRRKYAPGERLRANNGLLPGRQRLRTLKSTATKPH